MRVWDLLACAVLATGCDKIFGLDDPPLSPDSVIVDPGDTTPVKEKCDVGTPFPAGDSVMIDGPFSVESARFDPTETTGYVSLCPMVAMGQTLDTNTCDLYTSTRFDTPNGAILRNFNKLAISSNVFDSYPSITSDGEYLIFSTREGNGTSPVKNYISQSSAGSFSTKTMVAASDDLSASNEPYIVRPGRILYFSSANDLYRAEGDPPGFGGHAGRTSIASINTSMSEVAPVVDDDELEIFFASNRSPTPQTGNTLDIYTSTRPSAGDMWPVPRRVEELSDTTVGTREWPLWMSPDRCTLYYIRKGTTNLATLYRTTRPK